MNYVEFKEELLGTLKKVYGIANVKAFYIRKNNNVQKEAFSIRLWDGDDSKTTLIYLEDYYWNYLGRNMSVDRCVKEIIDLLKPVGEESAFHGMDYRLRDWENVKNEIYPMLRSTRLNKGNLNGLVKKELMDLTIIYAVRLEMELGVCHIKITERMLEAYGVSVMELHNQAMLNMRKDGYGFWKMDDMIREMSNEQEGEEKVTESVPECRSADESKPVIMYILTNSVKMYGAAGILDQEFVKENLGQKDYYMLPSSVHEVIFVPAIFGLEWEALNEMIREVNKDVVSEEDHLSDHYYFYEGKTGEIKICA